MKNSMQQRNFWKRSWVRVLFIWIVQAVGLVIIANFSDQISVGSFESALIAMLLISLINALLWPLLSSFIVPFAVLTLGFGSLAINAVFILFVSRIGGSFVVTGYWTAFWLSIYLSLITLVLSSLLTIDDDSSWYRNQVQRKKRRQGKIISSDKPGFIFLEIDGLAASVLKKVMNRGYLPNLQKWISSGSHKLISWETDTSSQTSASQAGILHGNNSEIPAFRWYDKNLNSIISSSSTKQLPIIEKRISNGKGLLSKDGASRGNLFSGDAKHVMATASSITDKTKFHTSEFQSYFASPYNFVRTILLFCWDVLLELFQFHQAKKNHTRPFLGKDHRGFPYPFIRATMTVLMRELNINTLIGDILSGRPVAYATFVGYDEVAHHSGVNDPSAYDILKKLDQQFGRLHNVIKDAPRPYHLVVLSDHGQTSGATFLQRYGISLQQLVKNLMSQQSNVVSWQGKSDEGADQLDTFVADTVANEQSFSAKLLRKLFTSQENSGHNKKHKEKAKHLDEAHSGSDAIVLASGNLGLISFPKINKRATLEQINKNNPQLIAGLVNHPGVGFVMVRSQKDGPVVMSKKGKLFLKTNKTVGINPLADFGENTADHLRRTDQFRNCPDILVNSFYDSKTNEGCAFEELIGFHGGFGGPQTKPFLLYPAELKVDAKLIGAASIYHTAKQWIQSQ